MINEFTNSMRSNPLMGLNISPKGGTVSYGYGLGKDAIEQSYISGSSVLSQHQPLMGLGHPMTKDVKMCGSSIINRGSGIRFGKGFGSTNKVASRSSLFGLNVQQPVYLSPLPFNPIPPPENKSMYNLGEETPLQYAQQHDNYNLSGGEMMRTLEGGDMGGSFFSNILNIAKNLFRGAKNIAPHIKKGIDQGKKIYETGKQIHEFSKNPSIKNIGKVIGNVTSGINQAKDLYSTGKEGIKAIKEIAKGKNDDEDDEFHDAETGEGMKKKRKTRGKGRGRKKVTRKTKGGSIPSSEVKKLLLKMEKVL